jgi:Mg2+ and Co2+ transporter CorA
MTDFISAACSLGVGAFLGSLIFIMYRRDRDQHDLQVREDRKFMEDRLTGIIGDYNAIVKERNEVMVSFTKALSELTTILIRMNGRHNG